MSWASVEVSSLSTLAMDFVSPENLATELNLTDDFNDDSQNNSKVSSHVRYEQTQVILLAIILIIIIILTVGGNIMVILTIARHRGMRTRTNMFITNLAVSDILAAIFDMPVSLITLIKGEWIFNEEFCQFNGFTMALFLITSIHTLMYISVHKYISITRPFSRFMTPRRIVIMIIGTWLWPIAYGVGAWLGWNRSVYKSGATQCGPSYPSDTLTRSHSVVNTIVNFLLPLMVLSFCYFRIFREIRNHMARMRETSNMDMKNTLAQQKRIATTLFMVMACFIACLSPYIGYSCSIAILNTKGVVPPILNPISYWCIYANSACNPIIYAFRSPSFRNGYKEIMCGKSVQYLSGGSFRSLSLRSWSYRSSVKSTAATQDTQANGSPRYHNRIYHRGSSSRRSSADSWRNMSFLASWRRHRQPSLESASLHRKNSDGVVPPNGCVQTKRSNGSIRTDGKLMHTITEDSCEDHDISPPKVPEIDCETEAKLLGSEEVQKEVTIIEEPEEDIEKYGREEQIEIEVFDTETAVDNRSNGNTSDEGMLYDSDVEVENSVRRPRTKKPRKRLESKSCIIQCRTAANESPCQLRGDNLKVLTQGGLSRSWSEFHRSHSTPTKSKKPHPPFLWQPSVDYLDIPTSLNRRSGHSEGNLIDKDDTHLRPISKRLTNSFKMLFRKSREKVLDENYPPKPCPENDL